MEFGVVDGGLEVVGGGEVRLDEAEAQGEEKGVVAGVELEELGEEAALYEQVGEFALELLELDCGGVLPDEGVLPREV